MMGGVVRVSFVGGSWSGVQTFFDESPATGPVIPVTARDWQMILNVVRPSAPATLLFSVE